MSLNFHIIHYEYTPLTLKPNQLEEFIVYKMFVRGIILFLMKNKSN